MNLMVHSGKVALITVRVFGYSKGTELGLEVGGPNFYPTRGLREMPPSFGDLMIGFSLCFTWVVIP
jgi:hypothetical protein